MTSREKVLQLLKEHQGEYLSGEEMAAALGISRNAVWKAVKSLREAGYAIEASTNRGYRLSGQADVLSEESVRMYLGDLAENLHIRLVETIDSTNRALIHEALSGAPSGSVLIAEEQTGGRGHKRSSFVSPKGGIYMSVLLRPQEIKTASANAASGRPDTTAVDAADQKPKTAAADASDLYPHGVTADTAAYVCAAVGEVCGIHVAADVMNNLYLEGKKIGGILTEAGTDFESGQIEWLVTGIGINFAVPAEAYPEEIRDQVTSIYPDGLPQESDISRNRLIAAILEELFADPGEGGSAK